MSEALTRSESASSSSNIWRHGASSPIVSACWMLVPREMNQPYQTAVEASFRGLGYVEGKSISFEYRSAGGQPERLPQLAAELVQLPVDVIVAGTNQDIAAAKAATSTIPIIMALGVDPVGAGFVESLARPGGNITGVTVDAAPETIIGKQLSLLKEAAPSTSRIAVLWNPLVPAYRTYFKAAQDSGGPDSFHWSTGCERT
jgi:putative ABC transport system substrate-binding protein